MFSDFNDKTMKDLMGTLFEEHPEMERFADMPMSDFMASARFSQSQMVDETMKESLIRVLVNSLDNWVYLEDSYNGAEHETIQNLGTFMDCDSGDEVDVWFCNIMFDGEGLDFQEEPLEPSIKYLTELSKKRGSNILLIDKMSKLINEKTRPGRAAVVAGLMISKDGSFSRPCFPKGVKSTVTDVIGTHSRYVKENGAGFEIELLDRDWFIDNEDVNKFLQAFAEASFPEDIHSTEFNPFGQE